MHRLLLLLCLLLLSGWVVAGEGADGPTVVRIGVTLDQIVGIDQKAENFSAVYTLRVRYREPALAYEPTPGAPPFRMLTFAKTMERLQAQGVVWPGMFLANQQGRHDLSRQGIRLYPDGEVHYIERATAVFQAPDFDFRDFPFDSQSFYIRAESLLPDSLFVFELLPEHIGVGDQLGEEEWQVFDSAAVVDTVTGADGLGYSRFSLGFQANRHLLYYVVRIFVPMLIILVVSWSTFRLKDYMKRIDIGITVLLLLIAFNFTLGNDLPRLGYLTAVDAFIAGTFVITGAVILVNVQLRIWQHQKREREAERLDRLARIGYWPAYLVGMSTALLLL
ncbi:MULTISPECIES: hypothetical protein [Marichromatium]|uniref:Neurotransmitter-gated ion-channel n=1 Tax=Marichromatium gracile TaxID=1048 RepID=A0A4R4AM26_MARGR|nr:MULTISPECIES: hypothetical protein [Marichromatium]MBO8085576.1 hypothetical protein [Marichromatium sp.]MBK1707608.1 hypothetical protein [Marichromatium gracile]RNE91917.1 electron transporter RnfC [Marichromatium sp. AB31]RNE92330.1 electron transporter RnfC [Marichromatium sp. AB32]TCW39959.1 neurotransmitter-gated ion-channel [Marichromatium gracile]